MPHESGVGNFGPIAGRPPPFHDASLEIHQPVLGDRDALEESPLREAIVPAAAWREHLDREKQGRDVLPIRRLTERWLRREERSADVRQCQG